MRGLRERAGTDGSEIFLFERETWNRSTTELLLVRRLYVLFQTWLTCIQGPIERWVWRSNGPGSPSFGSLREREETSSVETPLVATWTLHLVIE